MVEIGFFVGFPFEASIPVLSKFPLNLRTMARAQHQQRLLILAKEFSGHV